MTGLATRRQRHDVRPSDLGIRTLWPLWVALAALMARAVMYFSSVHQVGVDAHAYWLAGRHDHLYGRPPMMRDAFLYSPAFKQVIWPIAQLPWPCFYALWALAEAAAFAWLVRPLGWAWGVPIVLLCGFEVIAGNIMGFLAVAVVLGMRRTVAWSLPLLTKVVIGFGPLWFAVRRDWAAVGRVAGATAAIVAVSIAIAPGDWAAWVRFLAHNTGADPSLPFRFVAAAGLVVFAARREKAWLLAPAVVLASPVLHGVVQYLTVLTAIPRLRAMEAGRP
jgi:hypothetical protein